VPTRKAIVVDREDSTGQTTAENEYARRDETKTHVQAGEQGIRFLLVSGKPLEEPVAWYGPIVMNTQEQLKEAFEELERGTFLKNGG